MSTDFRALCAELFVELQNVIAVYHGEGGTHHISAADAVIDRARAAPAEPVAEGVTDEELLELTEDWPATTGPRHDLSGCPEVPLYSVFADEVVEFARAVLARYGHQPAPPAEGEAGELVAWLRRQAAKWQAISREAGLTRSLMAEQFTSAADLLEQQHPAPVSVRERLPGPEDCDEEHCCWRWNTIGGLWARQPLARSWYEFESHWLPAHDLPLPAGEVE